MDAVLCADQESVPTDKDNATELTWNYCFQPLICMQCQEQNSFSNSAERVCQTGVPWHCETLMEGDGPASWQESSWHHQAQASHCHLRLALAKLEGLDAIFGRRCFQSRLGTAGRPWGFQGCTETPRNRSDPGPWQRVRCEEGWYFKTGAALWSRRKRIP